jgi:hypothetical protein
MLFTKTLPQCQPKGLFQWPPADWHCTKQQQLKTKHQRVNFLKLEVWKACQCRQPTGWLLAANLILAIWKGNRGLKGTKRRPPPFAPQPSQSCSQILWWSRRAGESIWVLLLSAVLFGIHRCVGGYTGSLSQPASRIIMECVYMTSPEGAC